MNARRVSDLEIYRRHAPTSPDVSATIKTLVTEQSEVLSFAYPFDSAAVSLWREWVTNDSRVMHGMDPDYMLPFLKTEEVAEYARLIMSVKKQSCELAIVVVPDTTRLWPAQCWQLFSHDHLDVNGFAEPEAGADYDSIFDLAKTGLALENVKLSRLLLSKMQCVPPGRRKSLQRSIHLNAYFELSESSAYSIPAKLNRNIRRHKKRLQDEIGPIRLNATPADQESTDLFIDIESSGWKGESKCAIKYSKHLCRAYLAAAGHEGSLSRAYIFTLYAGSQPISSSYGLVYQDRISLLKIGFEEKFARFSPGSLLLSEIVEYSRANGILQLCLSTFPDWAKRWKPRQNNKNTAYIYGYGPAGRRRYAFDRAMRLPNKLVRTASRIGKLG